MRHRITSRTVCYKKRESGEETNIQGCGFVASKQGALLLLVHATVLLLEWIPTWISWIHISESMYVVLQISVPIVCFISCRSKASCGASLIYKIHLPSPIRTLLNQYWYEVAGAHPHGGRSSQIRIKALGLLAHTLESTFFHFTDGQIRFPCQLGDGHRNEGEA